MSYFHIHDLKEYSEPYIEYITWDENGDKISFDPRDGSKKKFYNRDFKQDCLKVGKKQLTKEEVHELYLKESSPPLFGGIEHPDMHDLSVVELLEIYKKHIDSNKEKNILDVILEKIGNKRLKWDGAWENSKSKDNLYLYVNNAKTKINSLYVCNILDNCEKLGIEKDKIIDEICNSIKEKISALFE